MIVCLEYDFKCFRRVKLGIGSGLEKARSQRVNKNKFTSQQAKRSFKPFVTRPTRCHLQHIGGTTVQETVNRIKTWKYELAAARAAPLRAPPPPHQAREAVKRGQQWGYRTCSWLPNRGKFLGLLQIKLGLKGHFKGPHLAAKCLLLWQVSCFLHFRAVSPLPATGNVVPIDTRELGEISFGWRSSCVCVCVWVERRFSAVFPFTASLSVFVFTNVLYKEG